MHSCLERAGALEEVLQSRIPDSEDLAQRSRRDQGAEQPRPCNSPLMRTILAHQSLGGMQRLPKQEERL